MGCCRLNEAGPTLGSSGLVLMDGKEHCGTHVDASGAAVGQHPGGASCHAEDWLERATSFVQHT